MAGHGEGQRRVGEGAGGDALEDQVVGSLCVVDTIPNNPPQWVTA